MSSTPTCRHHDEIIVGDDEARGPKPIAIECRADLATVGEGHRQGPSQVPSARRDTVERAALLSIKRIAAYAS
jgi:hypothetical protein